MSLPRFSLGFQIVSKDGTATIRFKDFIDRLTDAVEAADADLQAQITTIERMVRSQSFPSGAAIAASDAGADSTATVSAHTREYANASVTVDAGSVTALAYATQYFLYYDDPDQLGGAVTYLATTTQADALTSETNPDRHFVGAILTPAAAAPPTTGQQSTGGGALEVQ